MHAIRWLALWCGTGRRHLAKACQTRRLYSSAEQYLIRSPYPDVIIPSVTLTEFVWHGLDAWQDKISIECGVTGRCYTYAQARDGARRFAVSLQRLGLAPGDVLAVVLPNMPEYPLAVLGAIEAGVVVTTVNPAYTAGEISKQLKDCGARCILTDVDRHLTILEAVRQSGQTQIPVLVAGTNCIPEGAIDFRELTGSNVDMSATLKVSEQQSPDDLVLLPYSSGTTGLPKGVMLSHQNIVANMLQLHADPINLCIDTTKEHQDVVPAVLPFFHIYGLVVLLLDKFSMGSKVVTLPKFEPSTFLRTISDHKASLLFLAPPLVLFLASHPDVGPELLGSVRFIMSGAAPLGASDVERLLSKAPPSLGVVQGYGMTETSPVVMHLRKRCPSVAAVGPPIPNTTAKVADLETGTSLGPGQKGEVCCRGPQVMMGYLNNPGATAGIIDSDGWLHTGDVGQYDENLDFYIMDRVKELIKVKGFQVPPAELEELLRSHPQVVDAAVIGIPDERAGEVPRAVVVLKQPGRLTEAELMEFVADRVASYKHLAGGVVFVTSIPKNPSGKILRRQLRQMAPLG